MGNRKTTLQSFTWVIGLAGMLLFAFVMYNQFKSFKVAGLKKISEPTKASTVGK